MADVFCALPHATSAPFASIEVAVVAATPKTVLQVVTPSTQDLSIVGWGVDFDSATAGGEAKVELIETAAIAATVTSLTPDLYADPLGPPSLCVGGASATGYNASAEGTIVAMRMLDFQNVNIQSGFTIWYPEGKCPRVPVSRVTRIRVDSPSNVNCLPKIWWRE